jgi:hypothetical protein
VKSARIIEAVILIILFILSFMLFSGRGEDAPAETPIQFSP